MNLLPVTYRTAVTTLVVVVVGSCAERAQASILASEAFSAGASQDLSLGEIEAQLADLGGTSETCDDVMSGSSRSQRDARSPFPSEREDQTGHHYANFNPNSGPFPGSTGGSSTSTSSSSGGAGGVTLAVLAAPSAFQTDEPPAERYAAECALFLPDAPGMELLRPPQELASAR